MKRIIVIITYFIFLLTYKTHLLACDYVDKTTILSLANNHFKSIDLSGLKNNIDSRKAANIRNIDSVHYNFFVDSTTIIFSNHNKIEFFVASLFERIIYIDSSNSDILTNTSDERCHYAVDSKCNLYDLTYNGDYKKSMDYTKLAWSCIDSLRTNEDVLSFARMILFLNQIYESSVKIYYPVNTYKDLPNSYKPEISKNNEIYYVKLFVYFQVINKYVEYNFVIRPDKSFKLEKRNL